MFCVAARPGMNRKPPISKPPTEHPIDKYKPHPPVSEYSDSESSRYRRVRETSVKRNTQAREDSREKTQPYQSTLSGTNSMTKQISYPHHIARNNTNSDGSLREYSSESDEQETAHCSGNNSRTLTNGIGRSRMVRLDTHSPQSGETRVNQLASLKQKIQSKGYSNTSNLYTVFP